MKSFRTLAILLCASLSVQSQSVNTTGSIVANIARSGARSWSIGASTSTASPLNNGVTRTDYLFIRGFDFSGLPTNISVTSLSVTFTRQADATATDDEVRLVLGGVVYTGTNSNAAAVPTTWPAAASSQSYTFPAAALAVLNTTELQNSNFGVAIAALRTSGNISATVNNTATIFMTYDIVAPLILTNFNVSLNASNQVDIRFTTATEDNIEHIYVERSTDGYRFEQIFTIKPVGARNVYTAYAVTDKAPAQGTNYYRITEVDKNGRWAYYVTKTVNINRAGAAFSAYYNGSQVITSISNTPGIYHIAIADVSGAIVSRQQLTMTGKSATLNLPAPSRTGIYIIMLDGQGVHETVRMAICK
jgi:hypothetical protein